MKSFLVFISFFVFLGFSHSQENLSIPSTSQSDSLIQSMDSMPLGAKESKKIESKDPKKSLSAITITLSEMVDPGMAAYTKRAIEDASAKKPDIIFFEVNTFGGRLDAAFEIVDAITEIRGIKTVALVNKKAISAGALISLAADELYMKPNTTIGDCAPIIQGQDGPKMLGEKIQSPLRAKFRGLAQKNGYSELLSMAMVSENLEVLKLTSAKDSTVIEFMQSHHYEELSKAEKAKWKKKETLVQAGELLTITNSEAEKFGFSLGTVENLDELKDRYNVHEVKAIEISWSESLVRALGALAPILILIGFGALYIEIKTPGFGIFGIVGIICLGLVFGGQHLSGLSSHLGLVLFGLGVLLIIIEMLVFPGTWIAGMLGVICFIAAFSVTTGQAPEIPATPMDPVNPGATDPNLLDTLKNTLSSNKTAPFMGQLQQILLLALGGLVLPIAFARYVLPNIPARKGVMLAETLADSHVQDASFGFEIGQEGISMNLLKPTGSVEFDGNRVEVAARSGFIDAGKKVRICSLENHQVWVEEVS